MGSILNPNGKNSFKEIVDDRINGVFVDKSDFIGEMIENIDTSKKLIAFTRPRRFGKTITAQMLAAFFSKGADSKNIFSKLKISNFKTKKIVDEEEKIVTYEDYINKFNVIYWDLNDIEDSYQGYKEETSAYVYGVDDIVDYLKYTTVQELKKVYEFSEKINLVPEVGNKNLKAAISATGAKFILIMDEWDLFYREHRNNDILQRKFIDFLRGLFKGSSTLDYFSLVYLTGILPIKKYNSQTALNNFYECNMLTPEPYEKYFGFTEDEVIEIANKPWCSLTKNQLKSWYEGYKLNGIDVYNPNAVAKAAKSGKCREYWSGTSSNEEILQLINRYFDGLKDDVVNLIAGAKIPFSYKSFQNDMVNIENKDQAISLLVCLGYLGCETYKDDDVLKLAYVPNQEIRQDLNSLLIEQPWFNSLPIVKRSEKLFNAIIKVESKKVSEIIKEIHNSSSVSLLGYYTEEALTFTVRVGLMCCIENDYSCYREIQSGAGFVDLVYVPKFKTNLPIILFEFKNDDSAAIALKQIKEKNYVSRYCQDSLFNTIYMVGLSFNSKTKEHDCMIEKLEPNMLD